MTFCAETRNYLRVKKWALDLGWEIVFDFQAWTGSRYLKLEHAKTKYYLTIRVSNHPPKRHYRLSLHPGGTTLEEVLKELVFRAGGRYYE